MDTGITTTPVAGWRSRCRRSETNQKKRKTIPEPAAEAKSAAGFFLP
jgi:hypothetical protein